MEKKNNDKGELINRTDCLNRLHIYIYINAVKTQKSEAQRNTNRCRLKNVIKN